MKKSLYIKFVAFFLILGFMGFFAVSMIGPSMVENHLEDVYSGDLYREAASIAENRASKYYQEQASLDSVAMNLKTLSIYQDAEIWLISPKGEILLNTSDDFSAEEKKIIEHFNPGHSSGSYYQIGRFYSQFEEDHLSVMVPVTWKMSIQGYVAMHLPMSILQEQENDVMNIIYILILIIFLVMLLMLAVFSFMVYRPLKKIIAGADQFASGNLKHNIPVYTRDEMGYLALTLNYMSDELDKTGEYQRKFVSNVSHDFRSPLTSIKGYTEAILDGTIPPEL
ncbi:HAMP domain-containing protein, partial [Blautia pseudococcoides]|nr:HAMP domain-containing protein [Blautia pseudococcoides]